MNRSHNGGSRYSAVPSLVWVGAVLCALVMMACPPQPVPMPVADKPDTGDPPLTEEALTVCEKLRQLGCEEGSPPDGGATCESTWDSYAKIHDVPTECVHRAHSKGEVRNCGDPGFFECP